MLHHRILLLFGFERGGRGGRGVQESTLWGCVSTPSRHHRVCHPSHTLPPRPLAPPPAHTSPQRTEDPLHPPPPQPGPQNLLQLPGQQGRPRRGGQQQAPSHALRWGAGRRPCWHRPSWRGSPLQVRPASDRTKSHNRKSETGNREPVSFNLHCCLACSCLDRADACTCVTLEGVSPPSCRPRGPCSLTAARRRGACSQQTRPNGTSVNFDHPHMDISCMAISHENLVKDFRLKGLSMPQSRPAGTCKLTHGLKSNACASVLEQCIYNL